jgi:hypothetical protein
MRKILTLLITLVIIATTPPNVVVSSNNTTRTDLPIVTIDSFEDLIPFVKQAGPSTLLILDVDYTLFQPLVPAFQYGNFAKNAEFVRSTMQQIPKDLKNEFLTAIATAGEPQLIDEKAPAIIKQFKQQGARILALSSILTGPWKKIPDMMKWRVKKLKKAKVPLTNFGFKSTYCFKQLPSYRGNYAAVNGGVLLTNGENISKSVALEALLDKIAWRPHQIILVDDNRAVLEDMATYAQKNQINFVGFEYKGAKKATCEPITKETFEASWNQLIQDIQICSK